MGLVGAEVADGVGAGVSGVTEVGGPVVGGAGACGILKQQVAVLAAGFGQKEVEVIGGHRAVSFTTFTISCQALTNTGVHPRVACVKACARMAVGRGAGSTRRTQRVHAAGVRRQIR